MTAPARQAAERRGRRAELAALVLLILKGYHALGRRVKTPFGEIDLIVRRGRSVVFVEVKARGDEARAAEALSARQQARIGRAARWWIGRRDWAGDEVFRCDVVLVAGGFPRRHVVNAFEAGE